MSTVINSKADQLGKQDSDPAVPQESTGAIASDSLAAESMNSGGGFADNENAHVLGVKGGSSTLANEDTSGATTLHASDSGATREKEDAMGLGADEKGVTGVKYPEGAGSTSFSGTHTSEGYTGGPSADRQAATSASSTAASGTGGGSFDQSTSNIDSSKISSSGDAASSGSTGTSAKETGTESTETSATGTGTEAAGTSATSTATEPTDTPATGRGTESADTSATGTGTESTDTSATGTSTESAGTSTTQTGTTGVRPHVDQAPTAFANVQTPGQSKPKGANLTEGDIPETKTFTGDVGGPNDPGRVAEREMLQGNTAQAGEGVGGIRQSKDELTGSTGQYDVLQPERSDMQNPVGEPVDQ